MLRPPLRSGRRVPRLVALALVPLLAAACQPRERAVPGASPAAGPGNEPSPRPVKRKLDWPDAVADERRTEALRRARVWTAPAVPVAQADLAANPGGPGGFSPADDVSCHFVLKQSDGLTPKFFCVLASGEVVKVKYGRRNSEVFAETAATRLLRALGFGADQVSVVRQVQCLGCPPFPYPRFQILDAIQMDEGRTTVFKMAVIERSRPGLDIAGRTSEGWGFGELEQISAAAGGASRAEVDALRLLAVFLAHWDNKPANQALVCPMGEETPDASGCRSPFAFIQDLGKTFGPTHIDLGQWRERRIWADPAGCRVSMKALPFEGASFPDSRISEAGRRLLASLLGALTEEQLSALFTAARFADFEDQPKAGRDPAAWVEAFRFRVRQIEERTCPAESGSASPDR